MFKYYHLYPSSLQSLPEMEQRAFEDLIDLLQEIEDPSGRKPFTIYRPSQKTPAFGTCPTINIFFNTMVQDILTLKIRGAAHDNLTQDERDAIVTLKNNTAFVIKEADKGGNIVLWPTDLYVEEAKRQLLNTSLYTVLPSDPTSVFQKKLDALLADALSRNVIDVEALYTSIGHKEGLHAVSTFLKDDQDNISAHGPRDLCLEFISNLNSNQLNIKLTSKITSDNMDFLDLKLAIKGKKIETNLYRTGSVQTIQNERISTEDHSSSIPESHQHGPPYFAET
ncbi:uncharacterized protein LOC142302366 [Anomaloglossus baeobatrachus]|uniref:uncharacterized protein LOC142302366 n=1 Tax=Anomaloglossus baeobatrachus TaxID=238106 RepID=UPI003F4F4213